MFNPLLLAVLSVSVSAYSYQGFTYPPTFPDDTPKTVKDFTNEFLTARSLADTRSTFTSARLFTMIQAGTEDDTTAAIEAAINTSTTLLLGLRASSGEPAFAFELSALSNALELYGQQLTDLIVGIAVGHGDLDTGPTDQSEFGASAKEIVGYITDTRKVLSTGNASHIPVGHSDTWEAWVNSSNAAVIQASDFIGLDVSPFSQTTQANSIGNARTLFTAAFDQTIATTKDKPLWITETGWPVSGPVSNAAIPSLQNARKYWNDVGCQVFGTINTWWNTLQDDNPATSDPSFGVVGPDLGSIPLYNLSCFAPSLPGSQQDTNSGLATPSIPPVSLVLPTAQPPTALTTTLSTKAKATSTSTLPTCSSTLSSSSEFPHLIIPINATQPDTAFGTSYWGEFSRNVSSIFNFDIPPTDANLTCSLVFLFPDSTEMPTAAWSFTGDGGLIFQRLSAPATEMTTFNNAPTPSTILGLISPFTPGVGKVIGSGKCPSGSRISVQVSGTGDLHVKYFQDSRPPGIGLYINIC